MVAEPASVRGTGPKTAVLEGRIREEGGFTLIEFMISALIMTIVLGGTVGLAMQLQQAFQAHLDDAAAQQEARYALDWIARDLRSAGSDPYRVLDAALTIVLDPNGGGDPNDSIGLLADIAPADGDFDDAGENIVIAFDAADRVITRTDVNGDGLPTVMTDAIFTDIAFFPLDHTGAATAAPNSVTAVRVEVAAQSRGRNASTGQFTTFTLATEVRLRAR